MRIKVKDIKIMQKDFDFYPPLYFRYEDDGDYQTKRVVGVILIDRKIELIQTKPIGVGCLSTYTLEVTKGKPEETIDHIWKRGYHCSEKAFTRAIEIYQKELAKYQPQTLPNTAKANIS